MGNSVNLILFLLIALVLLIIRSYYQGFLVQFLVQIKSTLPNTESIGPNTAIRSPKLILLLNLFN